MKTDFRNLRANILLLLTVIFIFLVIAEIVSRFYFIRGEVLSKNFEYMLRPDGRPLIMTKNDFRKPLPETPKTNNRLRIIVLGDSFTWGDKLANHEDLWTSVLERNLQQDINDKDIEVVNLGLKGFTTVNELSTRFKEIISTSPSLSISISRSLNG